MLKILSYLSIVSVSCIYAVGFIYDSALLEIFHITFYQFIGTPIEYLALGCFLLLKGFASKFLIVLYVLGVIGCGYKPLERKIQATNMSKYIDPESFPIILISLLPPMLLLLSTLTIGSGQTGGRELIAQNKNTKNTIVYSKDLKEESHRGFIVRIRDGMILFYDVENSIPILVPQQNVLHSVYVQ